MAIIRGLGLLSYILLRFCGFRVSGLGLEVLCSGVRDSGIYLKPDKDLQHAERNLPRGRKGVRKTRGRFIRSPLQNYIGDFGKLPY